ncbi:MAG: hypothetical protein LBM23_00375 [Propionibacteriaceae bacterium]|jgi:uncharacterized membrane protein YvbJ|nr:hypothetical protein [Propionibacteriaceae bacterium]
MDINTVVAALLAGAGEAVGSAMTQSLGKLVVKIKDHFASKPRLNQELAKAITKGDRKEITSLVKSLSDTDDEIYAEIQSHKSELEKWYSSLSESSGSVTTGNIKNSKVVIASGSGNSISM